MSESQSNEGLTGEPRWLAWAKALHSVAHNGLHYAANDYERERYEQVERIAAEMLAAQTGSTDLRPILDLLRHDTGYVTPKTDVRGVVALDGKILLVREMMDEGRWTLPGGWADPNDTPAQAVEREVREESGYEARAVKLIAVYDRSHPRHAHQPPYPFHIYKLFFLCEVIGGKPAASHETTGARFFAKNELPAHLSVSRVTPSQLARAFEHLRNPGLPTDFD